MKPTKLFATMITVSFVVLSGCSKSSDSISATPSSSGGTLVVTQEASNTPSLPTAQAFVDSQIVEINALNEQPQYALISEDLELLKSEKLLDAQESERLARLTGAPSH